MNDELHERAEVYPDYEYGADLIAELAAALRAAEAERDELRIAIHGGCGCPAPYTECPHDEPLLPALNAARRRLTDLGSGLRAILNTECGFGGSITARGEKRLAALLDVPAADTASGDTP